MYSLKNFMIEMIYNMNEEPNLEIETKVITKKVDKNEDEPGCFLSHIYRDGKKIVFVIMNYVAE